jgi:hypothetical protein
VRWAATGVFALVSVLRLVPECVLAGRWAGEREGVQAAGLSADPLPGPSGGVSAIAFADDRGPLAGRTCSCSWSSISFGHLTGQRLLPVADTEVGCAQSLGREAGILAGVLEATACDPSKLKPTRQIT